ncbi:MAG TPA: mycofactocin precursor MftA [Desulfomonilaceae bacterium]|nr:mycofactocin precursor MftA [Desulfomonilaceae bacterium]
MEETKTVVQTDNPDRNRENQQDTDLRVTEIDLEEVAIDGICGVY